MTTKRASEDNAIVIGREDVLESILLRGRGEESDQSGRSASIVWCRAPRRDHYHSLARFYYVCPQSFKLYCLACKSLHRSI